MLLIKYLHTVKEYQNKEIKLFKQKYNSLVWKFEKVSR